MPVETGVREGGLGVASPDAVLVSPPTKLSWSAIFGGAFAALGIWAMLYALGLALGLSSVNTSDAGSLRFSGMFTGIWSLLAPLVALFVGGLVAGRGAGPQTQVGGAMQGLVMWGLTTVAGAWLLVSLVGAVLGTAVSVGKTAVQAGAGAVAGVASNAGKAAQTFGLDANDALAPINQRLSAEGKPTVTADQLQAATKNVVQDAIKTGKLDKQTLVSNLARDTRLSRKDSEDIANRVEAQVNAARSKVSQAVSSAAQTAETGALKAASATGKALWGVFGALILGMISAVLGALVGVSKRQRAWARGVAATPRISTGEPIHTAP